MNLSIGLKDAFIFSMFCILIVFIVLIVISVITNLIRIVVYRLRSVNETEKNLDIKKHLQETCNVKFEDIKDDDMLIAAFVASIDAVENNDNKTVKIKSIKKL